MSYRAWEFALAAQIVSHFGIVIDREAIDECPTCHVSVRRKNMARHVRSRRHRTEFRRAWPAPSPPRV